MLFAQEACTSLREDFDKVLEELEAMGEVQVNRDEPLCWFVRDLLAVQAAAASSPR